jgi:signal transduction histidine kinase
MPSGEKEINCRELINSMNDTLWIIDSDTTILDVNNTARVDDILDLTRSEKGDMKLEKGIFVTRELFRDIKISFAEKIRKKALKFTTNISPDLPGIITIDGARSKQVITNLIDNAVKYTAKGEVALTVYAIKNNEVNEKPILSSKYVTPAKECQRNSRKIV